MMKNKHYLKDMDLIHEDLKPENKGKLENQNIDEDLPGLGQYYCIDCAKYFVNL
jgi:bud site selection protein 20